LNKFSKNHLLFRAKFSKNHLLFRAKIDDFANNFLVAQPSCWDLARRSFRSENHKFGLCSYVQPTGRMRGSVECFVRPSCGFGCSRTILQLTTCPFLIILNLTFLIQVFFSAILLRLLPLQL